MFELAEKLIRAGVLYADDTPVEQMREVCPLQPALYHSCLYRVSSATAEDGPACSHRNCVHNARNNDAPDLAL